MRLPIAIAIAVSLTPVAARAQVTKESVPGVTNFSRVETTIACAGATTPAAVAELKQMGYASIINLRQPTEAGADMDAEAAAAKAYKAFAFITPFSSARLCSLALLSANIFRIALYA